MKYVFVFTALVLFSCNNATETPMPAEQAVDTLEVAVEEVADSAAAVVDTLAAE
jgi:hypothetical protein